MVTSCSYTSVWWLPCWGREMYCSDWEKDANCIVLHQHKWLLQQDLHVLVYVLLSYKIYKSCWSSHLRWRRAIRLAPSLNHCNTFCPSTWCPPYGSIQKYTNVTSSCNGFMCWCFSGVWYLGFFLQYSTILSYYIYILIIRDIFYIMGYIVYTCMYQSSYGVAILASLCVHSSFANSVQ